MREILFRGKRKDNGEWVYGNSVLFFKETTKIYGELVQWREIEVIPETVGQFTGLTDKNGKKIFEGDIVKCCSLEYGYTNKEVYYNEDKAGFVLSSLCTDYDFDEYITLEVIGNIYDNKELLGEKK